MPNLRGGCTRTPHGPLSLTLQTKAESPKRSAIWPLLFPEYRGSGRLRTDRRKKRRATGGAETRAGQTIVSAARRLLFRRSRVPEYRAGANQRQRWDGGISALLFAITRRARSPGSRVPGSCVHEMPCLSL